MNNSTEEKQSISAGFIQFYNDQVMDTISTFEESKKNYIDLFILQFTTWDGFVVNYNKNEIREWCNGNDSKIFVGLTGRGSEINGLHRDHTTYWKNGDEIDTDKISSLVQEDMSIVDNWSQGDNGFITGFYSSYEPLSTKYVESVGQEYDEYLSMLGGKLEEWANTNNRDVVLAFSGAVAKHISHNEFSRIEIQRRAKIFSKRVFDISRKILTDKNKLKLVFILQDGAGERNVRNDQLSASIRPFFVEVKNGLKTINDLEFWPLIEAFDKVGGHREHTSKDSLTLRLENVSDLGWNSGTEEKYRIAVFDLPRFNKTMSDD
uniref:hypothetical protein n=1 Tax=Candidatus Electrothrix sp. TaxID=2170559 RepID=UPI00405728AA